jgi:hypothetical protein
MRIIGTRSWEFFRWLALFAGGKSLIIALLPSKRRVRRIIIEFGYMQFAVGKLCSRANIRKLLLLYTFCISAWILAWLDWRTTNERGEWASVQVERCADRCQHGIQSFLHRWPRKLNATIWLFLCACCQGNRELVRGNSNTFSFSVRAAIGIEKLTRP